ncbi:MULTISPECIES: GDSL-type esterase/lipase family protein [Aeromonas]|uniref:GDSL-type esterase/lipase family protein n=1 Tax=Aeromonas bestiarum TaxID=105751 RepID=A0ABT7Q4N3_9GAMM|nr:GDSL-type esterase/lipase family protein [Aeromonas bestiarum]MDM5074273.1 GDSL-type esterase/lipase family protein [Aeromonas bestiarum]
MSYSVPSAPSMRDKWICTWLSTSQPASGDAFPFPSDIPVIHGAQTLRQTLRISLGGQKLRLIFSNRYGAQPLITGESYISVSDLCGALPVTFNGQTGAIIPAGGTLCSDEIPLDIPSLSVINLRTYLPEQIPVNTFHWDARHFSLLEPGNQAIREAAGDGQKISSRLLVESVQVQPESACRTLVVIGDSMVDGNGVEMDTYGRWTDFLAERLVPENIAVVNAGQSGSRLLKDGVGIATLSRFELDVVQQPGVTACIVQVGLNDIGLAGTALDPENPVPAATVLINAYRQLLKIAREYRIRMTGVTLVPLRGTGEYGIEHFYQPEKEVVRQAVNHWMRTSGEFDAVIDCDLLVRDPKCIQQLSAQYDSGDHLHLNHEGHLRVAQSVPLAVIRAD